MDWGLWIGVIGTVASIIGGAFSWWQASSSRSSAKEAKDVVRNLRASRHTAEFSSLYFSCKRACKAIEKYGPASSAVGLIGSNRHKDADDVQEFMTLLIEHRTLFGDSTPNDADTFYANLTTYVQMFVQSPNEHDLATNGSQLLKELGIISSHMKSKFDTAKEYLPR